MLFVYYDADIFSFSILSVFRRFSAFSYYLYYAIFHARGDVKNIRLSFYYAFSPFSFSSLFFVVLWIVKIMKNRHVRKMKICRRFSTIIFSPVENQYYAFRRSCLFLMKNEKLSFHCCFSSKNEDNEDEQA